MKRLVVVDTSVRVLYHSILVLSLYFLFAGHNQPGGGFVGGLTAGAAVSFRYVAGGVDEVRRAFPVRASTILGTGLLVSTLTAIVPMVLGHMVLEHAALETTLPVLGSVKATSALPFDIGVYLVVLGLVLMMFEAFGDDTAAVDVAGAPDSSVADAMAADTADGPTPDRPTPDRPTTDLATDLTSGMASDRSTTDQHDHRHEPGSAP